MTVLKAARVLPGPAWSEELSRDTILDEITLYWLTGTAASLVRFYFEQAALLGPDDD